MGREGGRASDVMGDSYVIGGIHLLKLSKCVDRGPGSSLTELNNISLRLNHSGNTNTFGGMRLSRKGGTLP